MNADDLRHTLRTPLNHIIGYAEITLEETGDASLSVLIGDARQIVALIQDAALDTDSDVVRLRQELLPRLQSLSAVVPPTQSADLQKVREAIHRLQCFAEDGTGSLDALGGPGANVASRPPGRDGGKANLLIVDDNAANREILQRHLERQNYSVTAARDGQECLNLLAAARFDLVLLDVMMPGLDGFEVLRRMRDDKASREIPVVMISALDETAGVVRCIEMGAEDYLTKPFDPVLLSARIGASLEKKRLRDEQRQRTEELQTALEELRRMQAQLVVQDKLASLGALTAGIAHEIRNPLNFVTNFATAAADLIQDLRVQASPTVLDQLEKYVSKIGEHGRRAERIVRSMLLHSRGKTGAKETVDINAMLNDCLNLAFHGLRAIDGDFNVRFEMKLDDALPPIEANPQELSRVFLNILNNACYAAHERKKHEAGFEPVVTVRTSHENSTVEIRIGDNGLGIPAEILPKIFDPFFTTKPAGMGTGLGLSLSHDIVVQMHNGTLRAESESGHGAEFIITLPVPTLS